MIVSLSPGVCITQDIHANGSSDRLLDTQEVFLYILHVKYELNYILAYKKS